jgi:hypothetical protein
VAGCHGRSGEHSGGGGGGTRISALLALLAWQQLESSRPVVVQLP